MAKTRRGRRSLFRGKTVRVQGLITREASAKVKAAKKRIAELTGWKVSDVSVADAIEFLARGEQASVEYWETTDLCAKG